MESTEVRKMRIFAIPKSGVIPKPLLLPRPMPTHPGLPILAPEYKKTPFPNLSQLPAEPKKPHLFLLPAESKKRPISLSTPEPKKPHLSVSPTEPKKTPPLPSLSPSPPETKKPTRRIAHEPRKPALLPSPPEPEKTPLPLHLLSTSPDGPGKRKPAASPDLPAKRNRTTSFPERHAAPSVRQIHRLRAASAVLSVDPSGFTLCNGSTAVCVDRSAGNASIAKEVCNMGTTELFLANQYSRRRWQDVAGSGEGGRECFRSRFFAALLLETVEEEKEKREVEGGMERQQIRGRKTQTQWTQRRWPPACIYCERTTCHRYNAVPLATDRVFPGSNLKPIRH